MNSPPSGLPLKSKSCLDLNKCVICKKVKDSSGNKKLTSTDKGRTTLIECSNVLNDDLFTDLQINELCQIKYHVSTCYGRYVKLTERIKSSPVVFESHVVKSPVPEQRAKRRKLEETEKVCIICDQKKCKGDEKKFRISEANQAKKFLSAINFFKDDVHRRSILLETVGDVFAADIMYHRNCMRKLHNQVPKRLATDNG